MKNITIVFPGSPVNYDIEYSGEEIKKDAYILVETSKGLELAQAICVPFDVPEKGKQTLAEGIEEAEKEQIFFVRPASKRDAEIAKENLILAGQIKSKTKELVKKYNLEMKISGVTITLDKSKAAIFFTAENRVDFRELVKELANTFKIRIELRQIGSRDETRIMGGFGPCGKICCCKEFLNDFGHVSIKMAKTQNLSLNPTKINGLCGRLMCCLGYENEHYAETEKLMPKINSEVITPSGKGKVLYNDLLKRSVQVKMGDENNFEIKNFDLSEIKQCNR